MPIRSITIKFDGANEPTKISVDKGRGHMAETLWEKKPAQPSDSESNRVDVGAENTNAINYWLNRPHAVQRISELQANDLVMAIGFNPQYADKIKPINGEIYSVTCTDGDGLIGVKALTSPAEHVSKYDRRRFAFVGRPNPQDGNWMISAGDGRNPAPGYEIDVAWGNYTFQVTPISSEMVAWDASHKFKIRFKRNEPKLMRGHVLTKETMLLLKRGDRVRFVWAEDSNGSPSDAIPWGKRATVAGVHGEQVYIDDETHGYHYTWLKFISRPWTEDHAKDALQYALDAKKASEPFTVQDDGTVRMNNARVWWPDVFPARSIFEYPYITSKERAERQAKHQAHIYLSTPGRDYDWAEKLFKDLKGENVTLKAWQVDGPEEDVYPSPTQPMPAAGTWLGDDMAGHLFIDGANLDTMSDDLRERVNAMLPAGATLTGVAYYPKPRDSVKIEYDLPTTVIIKMYAAEGDEDHYQIID